MYKIIAAEDPKSSRWLEAARRDLARPPRRGPAQEDAPSSRRARRLQARRLRRQREALSEA